MPPTSGAVRASVSVEDISRQYYESAGYSMWITQMHVDPLELIVADDASGKLYRVPVEMGKGGTFNFGDAQEVAIEYKDVKSPAGTKAAASMPFRWPTRTAAYAAAGVQGLAPNPAAPGAPSPEAPPRIAPDVTPAGAAIRKMAATPTATKTPDADPATGQPHKTEEASGMAIDAAKIREALGLTADAPLTDETKAELLAALGLVDPPPPDGESSTVADLLAAIPKDAEAIILDKENYRELVARAGKGVQAWERMERGERDTFLDKSCREGRFPPAKLASYQKMWDANPAATRDFVLMMPKNSVPAFASGMFGVEQTLNEADEAYAAVYGSREG